MPQRYSVTTLPIYNLLLWAKSGEIAIPEIQRPFVWDATKVRNLLDSLYNGYPVGYLIVWRNPTVKLKDGQSASGKKILIDGQQRVIALMAAILGETVIRKDYKNVRIRIAFNPLEERFEVCNSAIEKDVVWIDDVKRIFDPEASMFELLNDYTRINNSGIDRWKVEQVLDKVKQLTNNHVGIIELEEELEIETVTEIFIRVNSAGTPLSQADFAMSKIAVNETCDGHFLRKTIDYFCHLAESPDFYKTIQDFDTEFANSDFWPKMKWLKDINDDLYVPKYTDMLRVAFTSKFKRGKLEDLVALLSGRNFETREFDEEIVENSFGKLREGIEAFINETHYKRLNMFLRSTGFVTPSMIRSKNAVNFAFILYLKGREERVSPHEIERLVKRWYVMSILTQRYSGSTESIFDQDIRLISQPDLVKQANFVIENELSPSFWTGILPQFLDTPNASSPYFIAYQAAQIYQDDKGFLSRDISVRDLLLNRGDRHHVFPKKYLQDKFGLKRGQYNQIANFVIAQSEINIAIGSDSPKKYFAELVEQVNGGPTKYGGIAESKNLNMNLEQNCIPMEMLNSESMEYEDFLSKRRKLMSLKIQDWFSAL
ncbi:MAG: DUF262 domain-containing protein [Rhodobacteraceae bacterium]|nr:DUF262 domain-containing protein [Paracoccaceae bacterium]